MCVSCTGSWQQTGRRGGGTALSPVVLPCWSQCPVYCFPTWQTEVVCDPRHNVGINMYIWFFLQEKGLDFIECARKVEEKDPQWAMSFVQDGVPSPERRIEGGPGHVEPEGGWGAVWAAQVSSWGVMWAPLVLSHFSHCLENILHFIKQNHTGIKHLQVPTQIYISESKLTRCEKCCKSVSRLVNLFCCLWKCFATCFSVCKVNWFRDL